MPSWSGLRTCGRTSLRRAATSVGGGRSGRLVLALAEPGIQAVIVYRFGRWALKYPLLSLIYYPLHFAIHVLWGIELPRHAEIGPGLYIGHFGGHRLK